MSAQLAPAPAKGTISRVLRRYDLDPFGPGRVLTGYRATVKAKPAELAGRAAQTVFFPTGAEEDAHKWARLGWVDETAAWQAEHGGLYPHEQPEAPVPSTNAVLEQAVDEAHGFGPALRFIRAKVAAMDWTELRELAKDRSVKSGGRSRAEVEADVVRSFKPTE